MKTLVTGHRFYKLEAYDILWIRQAIIDAMENTFLQHTSIGLSGMASGVDLWFCGTCFFLKKRYIACIPFKEQDKTMEEHERITRESWIKNAAEVWSCRNSHMVEKADAGLVVWDGNKGGTHNVIQQLIEHNKPFVWINPVGKKIWELI